MLPPPQASIKIIEMHSHRQRTPFNWNWRVQNARKQAGPKKNRRQQNQQQHQMQSKWQLKVKIFFETHIRICNEFKQFSPMATMKRDMNVKERLIFKKKHVEHSYMTKSSWKNLFRFSTSETHRSKQRRKKSGRQCLCTRACVFELF